MNRTDTKTKDPQTLEQWTGILCDQEMPIFSNTAQKVYSSLDSTKKGAMDLSSIILQDPNLTAKLLKVSNSALYNPSRQKMSTISRAFVILGTKVVRELTVACSFFESIISPENKYQANKEIASAIHAAVQAKEIAIACNDKSPEEVFIAALLNNIGAIAFWCFGGKQCQYITELLQSGNYSSEEAEKQVLGFTLTDLGKSISKAWNLGGLIEEAIIHPTSSKTRPKIVHLAKEITQAISDDGWESEAMKSCLVKLEKMTGKEATVTTKQLKKNSQSAVEIACKFGAHDASQFIKTDADTDTPIAPSTEIVDKKQIQLHILQDIAQHISGSINLNLLLEMVVEGIHRGLGMDRSVFFILSPDKKTLNEKLAFGWLKSVNQQKLRFEISNLPNNLFFKAIHSKTGVWAHPEKDEILFTPNVINHIGKSECFLLPVLSDNKPIGLIYSDRSNNNNPLTAEDFSVAKHFSQQANIGLALYKIKKT